MQPIIEVKGLSKKYRLGEAQPYYTLRDSLAGLFKNPFARNAPGLEKGEFWALKDVNFEVKPGEVVGIVGRNGAGKSTLLKILSQITPPTEGEVIMRGRVGSLLEVGTGFSPELTGRENIYLNGAILGMSRAEVKRRFDEIVSFSEVEKFLDTPLKRYSSGMYMRLAFAVAAHLETEILIVDEVLAVGDAEFQKKALGKMGEVTKQGRTVLFVSHNILTVQNLCQRCLLLESGISKIYGDTKKVITAYTHEYSDSNLRVADKKIIDNSNVNTEIRLESIKISNLRNNSQLRSDDGLRIEAEYSSDNVEFIKHIRIVATIVSDLTKNIVLRLDSDVTNSTIPNAIKSKGIIICESEKINLVEGNYFVNLDFIVEGTSRSLTVDAARFNVITNLESYDYKSYPDRTVCNNVLKYKFYQP